MDRETKISDVLLIPPGETIADVLVDRKMTEKDLAVQTGCSEDVIHRVICGELPIAEDFANRMESVLDVPATFWLRLQANYDEERLRDKK